MVYGWIINTVHSKDADTNFIHHDGTGLIVYLIHCHFIKCTRNDLEHLFNLLPTSNAQDQSVLEKARDLHVKQRLPHHLLRFGIAVLPTIANHSPLRLTINFTYNGQSKFMNLFGEVVSPPRLPTPQTQGHATSSRTFLQASCLFGPLTVFASVSFVVARRDGLAVGGERQWQDCRGVFFG